MRSTFAGLNTMVRGVMANQMSLDTTGHNITNAGTDGYSRQKVTLATTYAEQRPGHYGNVMVGTGVDALAIERARDVYADIQYWKENPTLHYYEVRAKNYDKVETIFDDSQKLGIEEAINQFYRSWVDLSTTASTASFRKQVIEHGRNLSDLIQTASADLQDQIRSEYDDIRSELGEIDDMLSQIVTFNKQILMQENTGATANDLRDRRDHVVDKLSDYMNINVTENEFGAYQINSGGVTLVNGVTRAHLDMSDGVSSSLYGVDYGITDYTIKIRESNTVFIPQSGILKARLDAIAEDKSFIDSMADIAGFLLTAFNEQHKQGWDIDGHSKTDADGNTVPDTVNFYGVDGMSYQYRYDAEFNYRYVYMYNEDADDDSSNSNNKEGGELLSGVRIIAALELNSRLSENRGDRYIAAATSKQYVETTDDDGNISGTWEDMAWNNRTGDGTNAVYMSELFNIPFETLVSANKGNSDMLKDFCILRDKDGNAIDVKGKKISDGSSYVNETMLAKMSINSYYQEAMSFLGVNAYSTDVNYESMQDVMEQINMWRDSTAGVDYNEELTNMITFQKGYSSCARCLTTMDEMLDRLINSTGVVGR